MVPSWFRLRNLQVAIPPVENSVVPQISGQPKSWGVNRSDTLRCQDCRTPTSHRATDPAEGACHGQCACAVDRAIVLQAQVPDLHAQTGRKGALKNKLVFSLGQCSRK